MYDVSNSSCPSIFSDYFNHTHKTRHSASNNFYIEYSRLYKLNASFVIWSENMEQYTFGKKLGKKFNKVLHKSLLTILGLEDDYVDVPVLVR
jgi:hypothetical protein